MGTTTRVRTLPVVWAIALAALLIAASLVVQPALGLGPRHWTPGEAVEAFQQAGLEVSEVRDIRADPHPELPPPFADGLAFYTPDTALCMCPGYFPEVQVMAFGGRRTVRQGTRHYDALLATRQWDSVQRFAVDNVIVLATADIPFDLFLEYEAALSD